MINITMIEVQNGRLFGQMEAHSFINTVYCRMLFYSCGMYSIDQRYGSKQVLSDASCVFLQLVNNQ